MSTATESQEFFWNNKVFKIFAGYLVGSWTLLEFLAFTLPRLNISHFWTDIFLYVLLLFVPSLATLVLMPKDHSKKAVRVLRKAIPPLNIVAILLTLLFSFWGTELGAMTKEVTYEDENGVVQRTTVVKGDFVKKIIIFPFQGTDDEGKWLARGIPTAVEQNIRQFQGLDVDVGLPDLSLKEKLESLIQEGSILTGTYASRGDRIDVELRFYNKKGKVYHTSQLSAADLFTLSDLIKREIISVVKPIKSDQIDIPFSEVVTSNLAAFRKYVDGDLRGAFEEDPEFSYAYLDLIEHAFWFDYGDAYRKDLTLTGLDKMKRLPERDQLRLKTHYYLANGEKDKAVAIYRRFLELNPGDSKARFEYVDFLASVGLYDLAIEIGKDELSKRADFDYAEILYQLLLAKGDTDEILSWLGKFDLLISDLDMSMIEGQLLLVEKDYRKAIEKLKLAKLDDPLNTVLDSMIKSAKYMESAGEDSLQNFANQIAGLYFLEGSEQFITLSNQENQFRMLWRNQMPEVPINIAPNTFYVGLPYFDIGYQSWHKIYPSSEGDGIVVRTNESEGSQRGNDYHYYRMTSELALAFSHFENKEYTIADSLFRKVYAANSSYYFLDGYVNACNFLMDNDGGKLAFVGSKTFQSSNDDFEFVLVANEDHYVRRDLVIKKIYPSGEGWMINAFNKNVKYKWMDRPEGLGLETYVYNHDSARYIQLDYFYYEK